jgi:hypothetical protein
MTKKDDVLIARQLESSAQSHALKHITGKSLIVELVEDFAEALGNENPRFNRSLFLKACGVNN